MYIPVFPSYNLVECVGSINEKKMLYRLRSLEPYYAFSILIIYFDSNYMFLILKIIFNLNEILKKCYRYSRSLL